SPHNDGDLRLTRRSKWAARCRPLLFGIAREALENPASVVGSIFLYTPRDFNSRKQRKNSWREPWKVRRILHWQGTSGIEPLGEPVVNFGQHGARFVATTLFLEQPRNAHRRGQLPRLCTHTPLECERVAQMSA